MRRLSLMKQLQSAREHYARQQRISAAGVASAQVAWRAGNPRKLNAIVTLFQMLAARDAAESVPLMLAEQGETPSVAGQVAVSRLAGVASDGRPLGTLLDLAQTAEQLALFVLTQLQDAARVSGGVAITARQNVGYVRMLEGDSCDRCVVLAGRVYRWSKPFDRHPQCDCRHIPARENTADDLATNPDTYFRSLSPAEQDKTFGKGGAQAIRDGADISQVVNVRQGIGSTATVFGDARGRGRRLVPEAIYGLANGDRDMALRLLKQHGYLI